MSRENDRRFLFRQPPKHLRRPLARIQPILAKPGEPTVDTGKLTRMIEGVGKLEPTIAVESPEHWRETVLSLDSGVDAILPLSIPAYPTEVWNSHPQPLVERGLPVLFWPLIDYDEPDFWRWSARDMLRTLGVDAVIAESNRHGIDLLKAYAMRRFLRGSRMVVFGEQNFPWNAHAAGRFFKDSLGIEIVVRPLSDFRERAGACSDADVERVRRERLGRRYVEAGVAKEELRVALRTYLGIKSVLDEERAFGFGVNCFGDLITGGGRDVPCLAQCLLREDGCVASCDGDFCAMAGMALATHFLDAPAMMANMYPIRYVGALKDHFGDPLSPDAQKYPKSDWVNMARMAHCAFAGVVSPEMAEGGSVRLRDWGGTYEMKRDGRGCGIDGDPVTGRMTAIEFRFDARTLLLADTEAMESTRHAGMPHCESSLLLKFRDLQGFVENISREHVVLVRGACIEPLSTLAAVLGLTVKRF